MIDKETILSHLDYKSFYQSLVISLKENGDTQASGKCVFHDDKKASFSVNLKDGLWKCHAGCGGGDSISFLMKLKKIDFKQALKELEGIAGGPERGDRKIKAVYDYRDEKGILLYQAVRYEPKDFRPRRKGQDGKWIYGLDGVRRVLYNLPEVVKANHIIIVEGEKDVDNLKTTGFTGDMTVTTSQGGAEGWRPEYADCLKGKTVVIIPDNDRAGWKYAETVAKSLQGKDIVIKIMILPGLGEIKEKHGLDVSVWIELRRKECKTDNEIKSELLDLVENTPEWTPNQESKSPLSSLLKWNDILSLDVRTEYLLDKLIPKGSITLLFGRGGIGKTSLCLQVARATAEGMPFGELQTIKTPVYYIDFENPLSVLKQRVENIGQSDNLWVWHISNTLQPPRLDSKEWELYRQLPPGLLIFDTLRASHLSDENNSQDMAIVIARLKELREAGFTILLLHHTPKGNEGIYKGSTALLDLVDHVLSIESVKDADGEPIEFDKDNLYRLGVRIKTRYEPYNIFLKFNPEIKGFEIAKDPDIERIDDIYEILKTSPAGLKQKELKERAKNELDLTEGEIRKLLKKGEGIAWEVQRGGSGKENRALIYTPKLDRLIGQHIYSHPINLSNSETDKNLSNQTPLNRQQTLDNTCLVDRTDGNNPINKSDLKEVLL